VHGQNIRFHINCLYIVTYIVSHRPAQTRNFKLSLHNGDDEADNDDDDNNNNNISRPKFNNFN